VSSKISEILLDLPLTRRAHSQVLWRAGINYESTSRGWPQIGSPAPVCHNGCVHPIATGAGEDWLEKISALLIKCVQLLEKLRWRSARNDPARVCPEFF
jgi:hypothetical protein